MLIYLYLTKAEYLGNIPLLLKFVEKQNICSVSFPAIGKKFRKNFMKKAVKTTDQLGVKSLLFIGFVFPSE